MMFYTNCNSEKKDQIEVRVEAFKMLVDLLIKL